GAGPATVSGEPRPNVSRKPLGNTREGRATATIHESGDLIATRGQHPPFERKGAVVRQIIVAGALAVFGAVVSAEAQDVAPETKKVDPVVVTATTVPTPARELGVPLNAIPGEHFKT